MEAMEATGVTLRLATLQAPASPLVMQVAQAVLGDPEVWEANLVMLEPAATLGQVEAPRRVGVQVRMVLRVLVVMQVFSPVTQDPPVNLEAMGSRGTRT